MNIFLLSLNPEEAAEFHCDKHVIKMILETTQLLYMCWAYFDENNWRDNLEIQLTENKTMKEMKENNQKVNFSTYKCGKGHMNHPCSKWLRESSQNYKWLCELGLKLCEEKAHRWPKNKKHGSQGHLEVLSNNIPKGLKDLETNSYALAMPEECKLDNAVESYRKYYILHKQHIYKWTNRKNPFWIKNNII